MPRNGSGGYEPPASSWNPAVTLTDIDSGEWNDLLADIISAISQSIAADGQTPTTDRVAFALGLALNAGSLADTAIQRFGFPDTGITFPDPDAVALVAGEIEALRAVPGGLMIGEGTTAARPSGEGRGNRTIRFNTDKQRLEAGEAGSWSALGVPTGTICDFAGMAVPEGWLFCSGAVVSRTDYNRLYNVMTSRQNGTRANGSPIITNLLSTTLMQAGMPLSGPGIAAGAKILSVLSGVTIQMTANAQSTGTNEVVVAPWGVGDGSTTFNLPDLRARSTTGRVDMGTTAARPINVGSPGSAPNGFLIGDADAGTLITNKIVRT
jgi:microcystin-dependent protein